MTRKGRVTVTEPVVIAVVEPFALVAVELWEPAAEVAVADAIDATPPLPGLSAALGEGWRAIRVEPLVWWLRGPLCGLARMMARLEAPLAGTGVAVDLTGGFAQLRIAGPGWRDLLMIGGVFDAEDPAFGAGCTASTVLHHVAVRYDVVGPDEVSAYAPPSHLEGLLHHWRGAAGRRG